MKLKLEEGIWNLNEGVHDRSASEANDHFAETLGKAGNLPLQFTQQTIKQTNPPDEELKNLDKLQIHLVQLSNIANSSNQNSLLCKLSSPNKSINKKCEYCGCRCKERRRSNSLTPFKSSERFSGIEIDLRDIETNICQICQMQNIGNQGQVCSYCAALQSAQQNYKGVQGLIIQIQKIQENALHPKPPVQGVSKNQNPLRTNNMLREAETDRRLTKFKPTKQPAPRKQDLQIQIADQQYHLFDNQIYKILLPPSQLEEISCLPLPLSQLNTNIEAANLNLGPITPQFANRRHLSNSENLDPNKLPPLNEDGQSKQGLILKIVEKANSQAANLLSEINLIDKEFTLNSINSYRALQHSCQSQLAEIIQIMIPVIRDISLLFPDHAKIVDKGFNMYTKVIDSIMGRLKVVCQVNQSQMISQIKKKYQKRILSLKLIIKKYETLIELYKRQMPKRLEQDSKTAASMQKMVAKAFQMSNKQCCIQVFFELIYQKAFQGVIKYAFIYKTLIISGLLLNTHVYSKSKTIKQWREWILMSQMIFHGQKNIVLVNQATQQRMKRFVQQKKLPHLLLYGPPGTGKTSTITAVAKEMYQSAFHIMTLELNASDDRGINVVRDQIKQFASTQQIMSKGIKLVILDEADSMTNAAQFALRRIIEKYTKTTRFCLICNYVSKIIPALQSRCTRFRFLPLSAANASDRIRQIAAAENVPLTPDGLTAILKLG